MKQAILLPLLLCIFVTAGSAFATTVSVPALPGTEGQTTVNIPVNVDDATGIAGYQFDITYDPTVLNCTSAVKGSLTASWTNFTGNYAPAGHLNILDFDNNFIPLAGVSGDLAVITCSVIGAPGASTAIHFANIGGMTLLMDADTNQLPAEFVDGSFTVFSADVTPPDTSITSHPPAATKNTTAGFGFTSTETGSTFECKLDSGAYTACTSPNSYTGLAAGPHTFSVKATDEAGNPDATPAAFTWKIDNTVPTLGTLTPTPITTEQGRAQKFTAVYSDADGYANLKTVDLRVTPSGGGADSVWARFDRVKNKLYLYNDAGTGFVPGNCTPGSAGELSNSQGALNCSATNRTMSGKDLTVNWNITPTASFAGAKYMKMKATDAAGNASSFAVKGKWTIIATNTKPALGTLTPATLTSAVGVAKTFTAVYSDPDGSANLKTAELLVTTSGSTGSAIRAKYNRTAKKLYLYDDGGATAIGSCSPGKAVMLSNAQGDLDCSTTTVSESGPDLTVKWNVKPKAAFTGAKQIKMKVTDNSNAAVGWVKKGAWTIQ